MTEEKEIVVVGTKERTPISIGFARCTECGEKVYYTDRWGESDIEPDKFICRECQVKRMIEGEEGETMIAEHTVEKFNKICGTNLEKEDLKKLIKKDMERRKVIKEAEKEEEKFIGG